MRPKEKHFLILDQLKGFGIPQKELQSLFVYSLQNEAKALSLLKKFSVVPQQRSENQENTEKEKTQVVDNQPLITDFPIALHGVYRLKKEVFLQACSFKMALNALADDDCENALKIQLKIFHLFEKLDECNTILDHWTQHKRILKTTTKADFSALSPMELLQKRNTLRSNLTSRKKTLLKLESQPNKTLKMNDKIIKKQEEIKEIALQIEKLNELINEK